MCWFTGTEGTNGDSHLNHLNLDTFQMAKIPPSHQSQPPFLVPGPHSASPRNLGCCFFEGGRTAGRRVFQLADQGVGNSGNGRFQDESN